MDLLISMVDIQIHYIIRDDTKTTISASVYRGAITTQPELTATYLVTKQLENITRYRRTIKEATRTITLPVSVTEEDIWTALKVILTGRAMLLGDTIWSEQLNITKPI